MIVEYVGEKIRPEVANVRELAYERQGIGSSYLFRIDDNVVGYWFSRLTFPIPIH
jgi:histone-lysine N-methyltransferase SETD1